MMNGIRGLLKKFTAGGLVTQAIDRRLLPASTGFKRNHATKQENPTPRILITGKIIRYA